MSIALRDSDIAIDIVGVGIRSARSDWRVGMTAHSERRQTTLDAGKALKAWNACRRGADIQGVAIHYAVGEES